MNLSQYTIKAQEAIQSAQQLSYNNKDAAIETLHLLKAILLDKDSSTEFLLKILQIKPTADGKVTEEEIKAIIKEGTEVGEVQEIEQDIVERVFHIGDRKVNSLMTHRSSMVYLSMDDTLDEIKTKVLDELHSVYPVCEDNIDEVVGVVFLKDLFANFEKGNFNLRSIAKEPSYFIEHTSAYKALENFKKTKVHYAFINIRIFAHLISICANIIDCFFTSR